MDRNAVIPFTTKERYQYLVEFSIVSEIFVLPETIITDIVDVAIVHINGKWINNYSTLNAITSVIEAYLEANDVVLYCYCDNKEIKRSKVRQHLLPQQHRNLLFNKMYERKGSKKYLNRSFIIKDPKNGNHYINLSSRISNSEQIDIIEAQLLKMEK